MISLVNTAVCMGVEGRNIRVETDISKGLPYINIVGLASTTVMEAKERIKSAIVNAGLEYPRGRITVNLAPAGLRKNGSCLDLPIAIAVLASDGEINPAKLKDCGFLGELSLDARVLYVDGVLPMIMSLYKEGVKTIYIPQENLYETSIISGPEIIPVSSLRQCVEIINTGDKSQIKGCINEELKAKGPAGHCANKGKANAEGIRKEEKLDYADIYGQENAKRAISIAVTGRHGLLMVGSPGCGKTMLARRMPSIMPEMSSEEIIETAVINSAASGMVNYALRQRPFRAPHNSIGKAGLLGGGVHYPIPGEISLAHNGVLFLDEACEFDRDSLQALRQPLEDKQIVHFRHGQAYRFPCNFQLVMATNPCPCGYYGDQEQICKCSAIQVENYRKKLSGPILDRIDMRLVMEKVSFENMSKETEKGKSSSELRADVERGLAFARKQGRSMPNSSILDSDLEKYCSLGEEEMDLMNIAYQRLKLSPRSYNRILRVARTIADMDESEEIKAQHLTEALSYRTIDVAGIEEP